MEKSTKEERQQKKVTGDGRSRILWRGIGYSLKLSRKDSGTYAFKFLELQEGGATVAIAAWDQELRNEESICVCSEGTNGAQVLWHDDRIIHRDTVTPKGVQRTTVLEVNFTISFMHVIWSSGILLVEEQSLCNLHVFDTSTLKCLGYITLQGDSQSLLPLGSPIRFDNDTGMLCCLVRRYNEFTKVTTAHLNCYAVPEISLVSSIEMPHGFTNFALVSLRQSPQGPPQQITDFATILCTHELLPDCQLLRFAGPKRPYLQENYGDQNCIVQLEREVTWDRDFQPQLFGLDTNCDQLGSSDTY